MGCLSKKYTLEIQQVGEELQESLADIDAGVLQAREELANIDAALLQAQEELANSDADSKEPPPAT